MIGKIFNNSFFNNQFSPADLILHVSSKCNANCQKCFNWKRLNYQNRDLQIDEYEKISKQLRGLLWLSISGGEPFLREDLPDICELFCNNTGLITLGISTNGLLTENIYTLCEDILTRIKIPLIIDISLDDLNERYDYLKGVKGGFKKLMQTYKMLSLLLKKFSHLSIKIITVISNENMANIEEISRFISNNMKNVNFHSIIFLRGNPRDKRICLPRLSELEGKKDFIKQCFRNLRLDNNLSWLEKKLALEMRQYLLDINLQTLREKRQIIPCLAGRKHLVIFSNGDISFCEMLEKIGNLRDTDFNLSELWNSNKANEKRNFIKNNGCFCTHECVQLINIIFNKKLYFPLTLSFLKNIRF